MSYDHQFKLLTLGESFVGKTSLIIQYVDETFNSNYISTIGVDYKTKQIQFESKNIQLCIWDTAGQERFKHLTKQYYKGADGIILVFDITQRETLTKVNDWIKDINSYLLKDEVGLIIVGNKCDLESERQIEYNQGEAFAKKHGIQFIEVSALNNTNVQPAFEMLVAEIIDKQKKRNDSLSSSASSKSNNNKKKIIVSLDKEATNDSGINNKKNCTC